MKTQMMVVAKKTSIRPMSFSKKITKLFTFILCLVSLGISAQNIVFADTNFKQAILGTYPWRDFYVELYDENGNNISKSIDVNGDGEVQRSEAEKVHKMIFVCEEFNYHQARFGSLEGINYFTNLEFIEYNERRTNNLYLRPELEEIVLDGLNNLKTFNLGKCFVKKLSIKNCSGITDILLDYIYNHYDYDAKGNQELIVENCPALKNLISANNNLLSISVLNCPNLVKIDIHGNSLTSFNASLFPNLEYLDVSNLNFVHFDILNPTEEEKMIYFYSSESPQSHINPRLKSLNVNGLSKLKYLDTRYQLLSDLDLTSLSELTHLDCSYNNNLTSIDLSSNLKLINLDCSNSNLTNIDLSSNLKLTNLDCSRNNLTSMDVSHHINLQHLNCSYNNLTTLDLNANHSLDELQFNDNLNLKYLFIKNGREQIFGFASAIGSLFTKTAIQYVCTDDFEVEMVNSLLVQSGKTAYVNTYCTSVPGGAYNTITGKVRFDENNNGCDPNDGFAEHVKLKIDDGTNSGITFVEKSGDYKFYAPSGDFTVTLLPENPSLFTITPSSFSTNFADSNNHVYSQDICVVPNGVHPDLEVVLIPVMSARPGFSATYKLVYRNKGNQVQSGSVSLSFDHSRMDFISSTVSASSVTGNQLIWNFNDLKPYENKSIEIGFLINTPTNPTNPVNNGDNLNFVATVNPALGDKTPADNSFNLTQTVIGSFDPNDIMCLEGSTVPVSTIGEYMHYVVNFENTGTAEAENIVVAMDINPDDFDISTLQLQNATGEVYTRITGNKVEFIFEKIKLGSNEHGNVLLKVKSKSNLTKDDVLINNANIYFDYNYPVKTNDAVTQFSTYLKTNEVKNDNGIKIFPIPANDLVNITSEKQINSIDIYDINGRIVQKVISKSNRAEINIKNYSKGVYFVIIKTGEGINYKKIIKE